MQVTERTLFPEDRCNPDKFSVEERIFLLEHLGETPRAAGVVMNDRTGEYEHPELSRPVQVVVARVALQRFWEECTKSDNEEANKARKMRIRKYFMASLEGHRRTMEIRAAHGGKVDYSFIGIGRGAGQTSISSAFAFDLSSKVAPPKRNWFQDLIDDLENDESLDLEGIEHRLADALDKDVEELVKAEEAMAQDATSDEAPEVEEPEEEPVVTTACPYCDWESKPKDSAPHRSFNNHVRMGHPERYEEHKLTQAVLSKPSGAKDAANA